MRDSVDSIDLLFTGIYNNYYYFDRYVPDAMMAALKLFGYRDEAHIRDMGCLSWQEQEEHVWSEDGLVIRVQGYRLTESIVMGVIFNGWRSWGTVMSTDPEEPEVARLIDQAINDQLHDYYNAVRRLEQTAGLYYMVSDGGRTLTNLDPESAARGADFFRAQPVFMLREARDEVESSQPIQNHYFEYGYYNILDGDVSGYIAFAQGAVDAQNDAWAAVQRRLTVNLSIIIVSGIAILALMIILMAGAGRRYGDEGALTHKTAPELALIPELGPAPAHAHSVRLTLMDKPWLDISLAITVAFGALVLYWFIMAASIAWRYDSARRLIMLCAALSVLFPLPVAWWATSFAKHIKAGKWWRHTIFYIVINGVFGWAIRLAKSLWAGMRLTVRAILLSIIMLVIFFICIGLSHEAGAALLICLLFTGAATFGMLRYAKRLHLVERGAAVAAAGAASSRGAPIAVAGGELGSIAASINNISDGINAAVAERMKSERLKTELITNVSHDIRTPLTSVITYTDLLKNEGLDSARAPEYLDVVIQKSARLKTLTDDLFEASKAASGNIDVHAQNLDLSDFVKQVLGELDERVRASGLDFRLALPERAPVRADGKLLWRVMENLLSNVFHYALAGSRVYIGVAAEGGAAEGGLAEGGAPESDKPIMVDGWYRLDIKNISERALNVDPSELTERFKRGDSARSGDGGSGLGLSIAQSFTQAQGGKFEISIDGDLFKASLSLPAAG
ncbi:MAG: hypothetical protein FWH01_17840 [Oscillospiraceae bacterium]|nr:hypothetical protein [Oscillospiraceae bacterium]